MGDSLRGHRCHSTAGHEDIGGEIAVRGGDLYINLLANTTKKEVPPTRRHA